MAKQLLLFLGIFFSVYAHASLDTVKLDGPNDIRIVKYLKEIQDCNGTLGIEGVIAKLNSGQFQSMQEAKVVNKGITSCSHWFALSIQNISPLREHYLWNFYNDGIQFTLYELDSTGTKVIKKRSISHTTPLNERDQPLRCISFDIPLESQQAKIFLLKTEIFGRQTLYFPTDISTRADIYKYELHRTFLLGRYYGFFIFACIFSLLIYFILRKRFYANLFGYVFCLLCFSLTEYLHDVYLIPPSLYYYWSKVPKLVFLALSLYFNTKIFQTFTKNHEFLPKFDRWLTLSSKIALANTAVYLILYNIPLLPTAPQQLIQFIFINYLTFQTLFLFCNICYSIYRKTPYIFHYSVGNSLLFVSVLLYMINSLNIYEIQQYIEPGNIIFAYSFEIVYLMTLFTINYKKEMDHLLDNIKSEEKRSKYLAAELIVIQEKERIRIARDIHDGIGNWLNALRLFLSKEQLKEQAKINENIQGLNHEFRRLLHDIAPQQMEGQNLFENISRVVSLYDQHLHISCQLIGNPLIIKSDLAINALRIVQELLSNIVKHAQANNVQITLSIDENSLVLQVEDDGTGILPKSAPHTIKNMGIESIRSRVEYHNGKLDMDNTPEGLITNIIIPL